MNEYIFLCKPFIRASLSLQFKAISVIRHDQNFKKYISWVKCSTFTKLMTHFCSWEFSFEKIDGTQLHHTLAGGLNTLYSHMYKKEEEGGLSLEA